VTNAAPQPKTPAAEPEAAVLLDLAVRAARASAVELHNRAGRAGAIAYKSTATDPVSDADRAAEAAIVALLTSERPDDGLFGEEGAARRGSSGFRWVIDPLDGTVNYLYGIGHSAVSIGCEQESGDGWHAVVGVVLDIARAETFTAVLGGGARLRGAPLRVNDPVPLASALVATGFSYRASSRQRQAATVAHLLPRVRDIRRAGSAALDLCWLAAGRYDGYYEDELNRWDWSAGALIASESGALVSPLAGGLVASGPALHPALCAALARS
jgi:myo-inositol-1(or 4)-monophosphatase